MLRYVLRRSILRQAIKWLGNLVLLLIVLLAGFVFLAPRFFGWSFDPVLSGSMSPALRVGAVIVVQPVDPARVKVGDIITYHLSEEPGKRVTHRVVDVLYQNGSLTFRTKGDANEEPDMYVVPERSVIGVVRFSVPLAGYLAHYVRTPLGFGLCIALPGALLIASELKNIVTAIRSTKRRGVV